MAYIRSIDRIIWTDKNPCTPEARMMSARFDLQNDPEDREAAREELIEAFMALSDDRKRFYMRTDFVPGFELLNKKRHKGN